MRSNKKSWRASGGIRVNLNLNLNFLLSPEHQAEMEPFLFHQVSSEPEGSTVGEEDHTLGETVTSSVNVCLFQGCFVRSIQLGLIRLHKLLLLAQTCNGPDVVQGLSRNLQIEDRS